MKDSLAVGFQDGQHQFPLPPVCTSCSFFLPSAAGAMSPHWNLGWVSDCFDQASVDEVTFWDFQAEAWKRPGNFHFLLFGVLSFHERCTGSHRGESLPWGIQGTIHLTPHHHQMLLHESYPIILLLHNRPLQNIWSGSKVTFTYSYIFNLCRAWHRCLMLCIVPPGVNLIEG